MKNVLSILKERGLVESTTSVALEAFLSKPRKLYLGFDPTADSLHLGNLMGLIVLRWFQICGHHPVALIGGATGMIGDPSGKNTERNLLDEETLKLNQEGIASVLKKFLKEQCETTWSLVNNYDWFSKLSLIPFLRDIGKSFRMGPMLSKESVKGRIQSEEGMSFTEFTYQLLQGFDFLHLYENHDVCMQIGGSDQWGNITAGIELVRKKLGKEVHGLTFPLLTKSDGKKFGKSEKGAVWLSKDKCSPYQFYQFFINISDADVFNLLKKLTFLDLKEIEELKAQVASGARPNLAQEKLAEEVTRLVHGDEGLETALNVTKSIQPGQASQVLSEDVLEAVSGDMPCMEFSKEELDGVKLMDVFPKTALVASKGEYRRLLKNGGIYLNQEKVSDESYIVSDKDFIGSRMLVLGVGKKKKMLIKICPNG